jgi:hypothetical protein
MLFHRSHLTLVAASLTLLACADRSPTAPLTPQSEVSEVGLAKGGVPGRPGAQLTGAVNETVNGVAIVGTVRITKLQQDPVTGRLTALGVLSGTANGQAFTQAFTTVLATLSKGSATATASADVAYAAGTCDVLLLDLGPLFLDVLGLTVDLSRVVLDINAVAGAGNLLGNLLCAVVGLLDGGGLLASISNILDQINMILAAF